MKKKLFSLLALLMAVVTGAWAQSNTVTWNNYQLSEFNLSSQGDRETFDGVTITSNGGSVSDNAGSIYLNGAFTFSVPAGSVFTQIVIRDETWLSVEVDNTGWSVDEHQTGATWTGSARSVACQINAPHVQYIEFTIAPAVPKMYTSDVSITDLLPGDTLAAGATIIGSGNDDDMVYIDAGRTKENGVVQSYWTNLHLPPTVIGTNGTISGTYTPVDENGQDGNAWVVTSAEINYYDGFEVGLAGITIPVLYTVTLDDGGKDTQNWTIAPAKATTTGVAAGTTVTVTYSGTKKVKSVKATVKEDDPLATPLTIEALTAGTIVIQSPKVGMQYSLNGGTKTAAPTTDNINLAVQAGDKVQLYGNGTEISTYSGTRILGEGTGFTCNVYGNIMSLIDETGFATNKTLTNSNVFRSFFYDNKALKDASGLLLPAETLTTICYYSMFQDCSSLTAAPGLPATTLASSCYQSMFYGCSSLTAAPDLPATTLASNCYNQMFRDCSSLTAAPDLPAEALVSNCYRQMFQSCSKLASVKCLATSPGNATNNWLNGAGSDVTGDKYFYAVSTASWTENSPSGIPSGWTRVDIDN